MDEIALEQIVELWHRGMYPTRSLEEVIRGLTDWTHEQYGNWVARGTFPEGWLERKAVDKDLPAEAWIEHLARLLAQARFGRGVDMGGAHQPLPSERLIAAQYVQDLCEWMEQQR